MQDCQLLLFTKSMVLGRLEQTLASLCFVLLHRKSNTMTRWFVKSLSHGIVNTQNSPCCIISTQLMQLSHLTIAPLHWFQWVLLKSFMLKCQERLFKAKSSKSVFFDSLQYSVLRVLNNADVLQDFQDVDPVGTKEHGAPLCTGDSQDWSCTHRWVILLPWFLPCLTHSPISLRLLIKIQKLRLWKTSAAGKTCQESRPA